MIRSLILLLFVAMAAPAAIALKKPAERKKAPAFELQDVTGKPLKLADLAGRVVLVDFWATWCGPCAKSMPWMIELAEKYRESGLTIVGVSMDEEGWKVVKPFIEERKVTYPVVLGTKRVAYLYGDVEALPVAFFVDRNQRVAAIHIGEASRKDFEKAIQLLLDK